MCQASSQQPWSRVGLGIFPDGFPAATAFGNLERKLVTEFPLDLTSTKETLPSGPHATIIQPIERVSGLSGPVTKKPKYIPVWIVWAGLTTGENVESSKAFSYSW